LLLPWKDSVSREIYENLVKQMAVLGYSKGIDFNVVFRSANADSRQLAALAEELATLRLDLVVVATTIAVMAVRRANSTIPLVFFDVADPVASGLAEGLARPGRNSTGLTNFSAGELIAKRLGLLKQLVPNLTRVAYLINPVSASKGIEQWASAQGKTLGLQLFVVPASSLPELETAFRSITASGAQAVLVQVDSYFGDVGREIAAMLIRNRLPSNWGGAPPVEEGGLSSYGPAEDVDMRRVSSYVDKILHGQSASELPIQQPTKMELVVNRRTAEALGIKISPVLMLQVDRVIE
jgi:putative ABC transport system substrate-binding protein